MSSSYTVIIGNRSSGMAPSNSDEERYADYNNEDSRSNNFDGTYGDTEEGWFLFTCPTVSVLIALCFTLNLSSNVFRHRRCQ